MVKASREIRKGRTIRRMRWVLLAATLVAVGGVVALYVAGRAGRPAAPADDLEGELEPTGDLVTVGEGFERTFSEGERPVFTVRGERYAVDRKGIVLLEGVEVAIHQEDGSVYEVAAAKARLDVEKRQGRLSGGVRLSTPAGLTATMRELYVLKQGALLASQGQVGLTLGESFEGSAEKLWVTPGRRLIHLRGDVDLRGIAGEAAGFRLRGRDVTLDLVRHLFRVDGDAVLSRRGEVVRARRIVAFLDKVSDEVRYVRARWEVWARLDRRGTLAELDSGDDGGSGDRPNVSRLVVECEDLGMAVDPEGRDGQQVDIAGGPRGVARMTAVGAGGGPRHVLEAARISAALEGGRPVRVQAEERVLLAATTGPMADAGGDAGAGSGIREGERRATGDRAVGSFGPEGELSSVELTGDVVLLDDSLEATGRRAVYDLLQERAELEGDVVLTDAGRRATGERGVFDLVQNRAELFGRPAVVETDRGRMEAPRLRYTRADGLAHGTGGVRARLEEAEDSALGGTPLGRGDGPVWVEAEEGTFRDQPRTFLFQGRVRAWRGDDLLVANELRGDEPEDRLVATGDVRTLWVPEKDGAEAGEAEAPLEVRAAELVYRKSRRLLTYTGGVVARQEGRTMACREMELELAEGGGVAELVCAGAARVEDPVQGRTLVGERLLYHPDRRVVEVEAAAGGKVTMKDREGNVIEGPRMIYDLDADRVQVVGRAGEAAAPEDGGAGER